MGLFEILLIGVGLSMDAFAVAVGKGLCMPKVDKKQCLLIALFFGGFQALMPILGWLLGGTFASYIEAIDHWIAFFLLLYIGGKMLVDAVKEMREEEASGTVENTGTGNPRSMAATESGGFNASAETAAGTETAEKTLPPLPLGELLIMAVATSIDALAIGVTFSFLEVNIWKAASLIGCTTFVISAAGVFIGNRFGIKYKYRAAIAGGLILIFIGSRILLTHLLGLE